MSDTAGCFYCGKAIEQADVACRHCGKSRVGPDCPQCGLPVLQNRSHRSYYTNHHGCYPWHHGWDGKCASCGFEFVAEAKLRTGHSIQHSPRRNDLVRELPAEPSTDDCYAGISQITIRGGESVHTEYDLWDHQPMIEVRIRREVAANCGGPDAGLYAEDRIAMTPAEWAAVIAQLQGPLKVLMQREAWWEDTT